MHYLELFCVTLVHCYTMTVLAGFDVVGVTDCEIKSPCYPNPSYSIENVFIVNL